MGAAHNLDVYRRWADAEDRHDLTGHDAYLHADVEVVSPGAPPLVGLDAYREGIEATYVGLSDLRVLVDDNFTTDDRVVCRWRLTGRHTGPLFGFPPTDRAIEIPGISLWEFDGGRARRGWVMPDLAAIMAQLGA